MQEHNIRALVRGLDVLRHLNRTGGDTGHDVAASLALPRPTVYRILGTLEDCGMVARDPATSIYSVASGARDLSSGVTDEMSALWIATPILYELQQEVLWPTDLATYENGQMVIRETTHAVSPYSIDTGMLGSRHSLLNSSFGRAYISFCPDDERKDVLSRVDCLRPTDSVPGTAPEYLDRMIRESRAQGFASRQCEVHVKTSSIAVPIRHQCRVVACMSVVWIASAVKFGEAVRQFYPALARAQARVEQALSASKSEAVSTKTIARQGGASRRAA